MCCCIPLRRLSYLGSFLHIAIGFYFWYLLGHVAYYMFILSNSKNEQDAMTLKERTVMGLLYIGYYVAFLFPGFLIFMGVHKKIRKFLVLPPISFFLIVIYGLVLETIYGYRPSRLPEVYRLAERGTTSTLDLDRLRAGFWMDVFVKITALLVYLFMLFFYYREIGPESTTPVPSRYRQAYQQAAAAAAAASCNQQTQQGMMSPGSILASQHHHRNFELPASSSSVGRTFHPLSVVPTTSSLPPFNMPNQSQEAPPRSNNAHFIRSANNSLLDSFSNLTLDQQRELAILQAHPLLNQQQQQIHPQHLQQLLSSQDPRLLEFLQAQAAQQAQAKNKNLY